MAVSSSKRKRKGKQKKRSRLMQPVKERESKVWKWWKAKKSGKRKDGVKWRTLEHNGPVFAPEYRRVPKRVKFYYNGRPMRLSKAAEEVAGFYGKMLNEQYTKKKEFNENFFNDWTEIMKPKERKKIKGFDKCDFWDFHDFYEEEADKKKRKSASEKAKIKKKKEDEIAKHGFCMVDGRKQKLTNFRLEPPGLFRGRGKHPKMGKLKRRVEAKDVCINIGKNAPTPRAPRGHRWEEVIHDNTVTWLARWTDNISGKIKYIMLNPSSRLKGQKDIQKYEMARRLKDQIRRIRKDYMKYLSSDDIEDRQMGVALYFIDRLALRTGNEKGAETADTVGCCSLRVEHISLDEKLGSDRFVVHFNFPGKDSIRYKNRVLVDENVYWNIEEFLEEKKRGSYLFDYLNPTMLNSYLNMAMEGLTAKVFRTYHASVELEHCLKSMTKKSMSLDEKLLVYNSANRSAAILCNHRRAVPKTYVTSMKKLERKMKAKQKQVKEWIKKVKKIEKKYGEEECEEEGLASKELKKIRRARSQIEKMQMQASLKEDNKDVTLATSKLNYLDPRITVAWCKKWKVPIEKIYNKTQRERFQWAIETTQANFRF